MSFVEASEVPATSPTRVLLVDDHAIFRDALQDLLQNSGDFKVVGHAGNGVAAVNMAAELEPDVVLMDVFMPIKDGIEACREIMDQSPDANVLILTASTEEHAVIEAIAAGATGYVQKIHGREPLLSALRDVAAGEYRFPNDALRRVFAGIREARGRRDPTESDQLRPREREMLTRYAQGRSYAEIALERSLSRFTVRNTINSIQDKLGLSSKQEMVVWAVRNGLLDNDPNPP